MTAVESIGMDAGSVILWLFADKIRFFRTKAHYVGDLKKHFSPQIDKKKSPNFNFIEITAEISMVFPFTLL